MKISACVITKNEEKNIERSIRSYQDIADEIVVVDSGSTDDTVKIAESLGATVYHRDWTNDFAAAKNYAIERATGDWILFLDGDEYFADGDSAVAKEYILKAIASKMESVFSPRYELHEAGGPVQGISYVERIFKNDPNIRYSNKIHECLQKHGNALKQIQTDDFVIFHTGYDPQIFTDKIERNLKLLEDPDLVMERRYMKHLYLAESYNSLQRHEDAIRECDKLMALSEFEQVLFETQKVFHVYIIKAASMLALSDKFDERQTRKTIEEGMYNFGKHPEVRYIRSVFYQQYGYIDEAISDFEESLILNKNYKFRYENIFGGNLAAKFLNVANLYKIKNVPEKVRECLITVLQHDRNNEDVLWELLIQMEGMQTEEKQKIIESLYDIGQLDNISKVIQAAWLSGCNDLFAVYFLRLINNWPSEMTRDQGILCKVFLLQKNYEGILQITAHHPGEDLFRRFEFIALLARSEKGSKDVDRVIDEGRFEWNYGFVFGVLTELLQAHEYELIDLILDAQAADRIDELKNVDGKRNLAAVFERFQRWRPACSLYLDAGRQVMSEEDKNKDAVSEEPKKKNEIGALFLAAARMAYYAGDFAVCMDIMEEGLSFSKMQNHLPEQILKWIAEKTRGMDETAAKRAKKLQKSYERALGA